MKHLIYIALMLCVPVTTHAGVWTPFRVATDKTGAFIRHPQTCKYGFYAFWIFGRGFCDALVDAHRWENMGGPGHTRIINDGNWHVIKNARDFSTIIAGAFLGGAYAAGYIDAKGALKRFLFASALSYPTWRGNYTYARWGDWWDTSAAHNLHILPYPGPDLKDRYIAMEGSQVTAFYTALYFTGAIGVIRYDPAVKKVSCETMSTGYVFTNR